jgi:penicillin-binding protein 1C
MQRDGGDPDVRLAGIRRFVTRHRRAVLAGLAGAAALVWLRCGPLPAGLLDLDRRPSTVVLDRDGTTLYEARSAGGTRGEWLAAGDIPPVLADATRAAEDTRFLSHIGLDPIAMARAAWHDLARGRIVEGGSTITQQVAKLLLARQSGEAAPRGWVRKMREAVVALRLEHRLTKRQILALYLNLAPYGNQIDGAARAARAYFGVDVASLTPAQAAFLAALPQQPGRYNPWRDPAGARSRQVRILAVMRDQGWLPAGRYAAARAERLRLAPNQAALVAPHFVERVLALTAADHPRRVDTTLDAGLERTVEGIIAAHRDALDAHHAANVAVAVLDNRSGEWLAWEGSGNYFDAAHGGTIDGVVSPRQPGSALKPFTYAAAFERGATPATVLPDVPSQFPTAVAGVLYSPRNYDGLFRGPLLARAALAGSENVPAVALASRVGVPAIARLLRRAGLTTLDDNAAHYGLGLTLGNAEVRLDELVAAYAMLARGGESLTPHLVRAVDGRPVAAGPVERIVSLRSAFWVTDILADSQARAYVFGRGGSLEFPFTVAAKTGTSQAYHDNWAIGYTRDVTVGVWVGNFDRSPLRDSSGVTGAGPIFHDVMLAAVERVRGALPIGDDTPVVAPPADVRRTEVCTLSGMAATAACPARVTEWMPAGAAPAPCTWHHASDQGLITAWPDVYRQWARDEGLAVAPDHPARAGITAVHAARSPAGPAPLTIVEPLAGAVYLFDPTLRPQFQALTLRARGASPGTLDWFVDGARIGSTGPDESARWPLARGSHVVSVRDADGRSADVRIVVR